MFEFICFDYDDIVVQRSEGPSLLKTPVTIFQNGGPQSARFHLFYHSDGTGTGVAGETFKRLTVHPNSFKLVKFSNKSLLKS